MSNFHFLKKDLEWKIVNLQGWELLSHITPQPTNGTLSSWVFVQERTLYTLAPWLRARSALIAFAPFIALPRLSSILVQERKYPFLGSPEMSDKLRYEWQYVNTFQPVHLHPSPFWSSIFSLFSYHSREKTYILHYTPFRGSPEMSDKLRYESQIILRYYVLIIHEVSFSRHTTSPCKTISLERKTAPHFLSHWTTHLQYRPKYYAYSCTQ
jgi:hypothetical protein